jgi:N4-gp56 family major capsid protein
VGNADHFDLNDPETVQRWEKELHVQVALRTPLMSKRFGFIGDSNTSLVQKKTKLWENGGTQATTTLTRKLQQDPSFGDEELRGKEKAPNTATFKYQINQVRGATAIHGRVTQRRVNWDVWTNSKEALGTWVAELSESAAMLHLAGVKYDVSTAAEWYHKGNRLGNTFSNEPRTPDTAHIVRIGHSSDTDDTNVGNDVAAILDVDTISELKARAKSLPIPIRPAMVHGQELYVLFAHSYALRHMKSNSQWMAVMTAAMQGGKVDGHPFWTGALGIWDGVLIVENNYIPPGLSSTNTRVANARRNVFCGAQSLVLGVAKEFDKQNLFQNDVESWDYANNKGLAVTSFLGLAAPSYTIVEQDSAVHDYAKIVCTSYAQELFTSA